MKDFTVIAYSIYLPVIIMLTLFVAHSLFKNSLVYMKDIFHGRDEIARATNTLFKIGFYLLNVGFGLFILTIYNNVTTTQQTIEILSKKLGGFSIYLGLMLFINMYFFFRGKKVAKAKQTNTNMPVA